MANVLVVAELLEGNARKTTLCAVTAAKQIAEGTGGSFDILAIGEGAGAAAEELAGYGAGKVLKAEIPGGYTCEKYAATAAEVGKGYDVIIACASTYGKALLPRGSKKWQLYDLSIERTESQDLAEKHLARTAMMAAAWETWARQHQVK